MKKVYESPKVEKLAFDYSEAVVASGSTCHYEGEHGFGDSNCYDQTWNGHWVGNNT